jgi:hypothetical protein
MKKPTRHLSLRTETLVLLTTSQLVGVAGGRMNASRVSECVSCDTCNCPSNGCVA